MATHKQGAVSVVARNRKTPRQANVASSTAKPQVIQDVVGIDVVGIIVTTVASGSPPALKKADDLIVTTS